ncbi:hypothetical protein OROHE_004247 [Orobanche hederae]
MLDVPSNVVQKKKVARILLFKIRPSQEILKIRDGTPLEAEEILTYIKSPRNGSVCYFSSNLDVPSNVIQKKRVARILFFKIRPSQEILKIRDGTPLETEEILTYIKKPSKRSVCYLYSKFDVPSNVVQKKTVARILPSQEILKIRDGTPLETEEILTYIKKPSKRSVLQKKRVARILFFKIRPSQEILKIRDGIPLEAEEILAYIKSPRNGSVCYFSSKLDVPSNVVQKKKVARILFFKIRPSQEILKIRDGTPLEAEEILTYIKKPSKRSVCYLYSKFDVPSNVVQKKTVARILFSKIRLDVPSNVVQKKKVARILLFKIRPSQEILKIRDGTPLEAEEILTYIKSPRNGSVCYFSSNLDVPSNVIQKKRVARILFFKIRPSQEILKIRDGTPLETEEILTYIKKPSKRSVCYLYSKFDVPSNVVQKKTVARILPSQEILKIRDGTPLETEEILTYIKKPSKRSKKRVARILFFKIRPSQEILKIRDGIPLEAEEILAYIKSPRNGSVCYFSSKLDVPSNVVQKKKVARILFFKIRPSQEILKIRDGTPLEAEEILTYIKKPSKRSVCYLYSKFDVPSNVVQKKTVARILFSKIRPSQEI